MWINEKKKMYDKLITFEQSYIEYKNNNSISKNKNNIGRVLEVLRLNITWKTIVLEGVKF